MKPATRLRPALLSRYLRTEVFGRECCIMVDRTGSTNADALALELDAPHGAVVVAEYQTAGRGRGDRTWFSPPGANLLFSVLLRPPAPATAWPGLVLVAGVAVYEVVRGLVAAPVRLKWPNDVLIYGRKVAGILCQSRLGKNPAVAVGIGLNVNMTTRDLPRDLRTSAISLRDLDGRAHSRARVLALLLAALERQYDFWRRDRKRVWRAWEAAAHLRGAPIRVVEARREYDAVAQGLDRAGRLLVTIRGRRRTVVSGDVLLLKE